MSSSPLISILMPAKNAEKFIASCLESILQQSYPHWELVVVDDHSTDQTTKIISSYTSDNRIRLFHNTYKGIIPALRLALEQAKGIYITRMDADDLMPEHKLEVLSKALAEKGKGHIVTGKVRYFSDEFELMPGFINYENWLNELCDTHTHWEEIYKECPVASPAWMMHQDDLRACEAFDPLLYPEDYDLVFRWRNKGMRVVAIDEVVHLWRDHSQRASRTKEHYKNNFFAALKVLHFLTHDLNVNTPLYLWGAGKKGKEIAQLLYEKKTDFIWITNNPKKIGHLIYNQVIQPIPTRLQQVQVIVAVSSPSDLEKIRSYQQNNPAANFYFFC